MGWVYFVTYYHHSIFKGADVASEIRASPEVMDLLISFTMAAAIQGDVRRFSPFPQLELKVQDKETNLVRTLSFLTNNQPDANLVVNLFYSF